jgi:hypothetical protein
MVNLGQHSATKPALQTHTIIHILINDQKLLPGSSYYDI